MCYHLPLITKTSKPLILATMTGLVLFSSPLLAAERIPVLQLSGPVQVDGDLNEWASLGQSTYLPVPLHFSEWRTKDEENTEEEEDREARIMAGIYNQTLYFAIRWKDPTSNNFYKPWKFRRGKYQKQRKLDDLFVFRFRVGEKFSRCMLSSTTYQTDLWRWSAGRSNLSGVADDMIHRFSGTPFDTPSVEYDGKRGTVYFQKQMDPGSGGWTDTPKPKRGSGLSVPGIITEKPPEGSRSDVLAKGQWNEGYWSLEVSRSLKTSDPDDVVFKPGAVSEFQIGAFFSGYKLKKFISKILELDLRQIP